MNIGSSRQNNEDIVMMLQQPHVRPTGEQVAHTHRPWDRQTRPLQCKLPEGGVASDRIYTSDQQPDQQPPEHPEGFIEIRLGDVNQCLTELRGIWEHQTIEAEGHLQVMAWYADTERWPRCPDARVVQLPSDLSQWMTRLIEAWDDRADPDEVFHLHMIQPHPQTTFWEEHPAPHVLLFQRPRPNRRRLGCMVNNHITLHGAITQGKFLHVVNATLLCYKTLGSTFTQAMTLMPVAKASPGARSTTSAARSTSSVGTLRTEAGGIDGSNMITFGRYKGYTFADVYEMDAGYVQFALDERAKGSAYCTNM